MSPILLIVDDEPRIFQALRRTLHRENLELMHAASGEDALEMLERFPADIVLADENMPGMTGTQLLTIVRQRWPATVRMLLTGTARMDVVVKAVNQGQVSRFFTKPCDDAELIVAIRESLEERTTSSAGATPPATSAGSSQEGEAAPLSLSSGSDATGRTPEPKKMTMDGREATSEIRLDSMDGDEDVDELLADLRRSLDDMAG